MCTVRVGHPCISKMKFCSQVLNIKSTDVQEGDGVVPEEAQRKNPNAMKFIGGPAEVLRLFLFLFLLHTICMLLAPGNTMQDLGQAL